MQGQDAEQRAQQGVGRPGISPNREPPTVGPFLEFSTSLKYCVLEQTEQRKLSAP